MRFRRSRGKRLAPISIWRGVGSACSSGKEGSNERKTQTHPRKRQRFFRSRAGEGGSREPQASRGADDAYRGVLCSQRQDSGRGGEGPWPDTAALQRPSQGEDQPV